MKHGRYLALAFYDLAVIGLLGLALTVAFQMLGGSLDWKLLGACLVYAAAYSIAGWRMGVRPGDYLRRLREPL